MFIQNCAMFEIEKGQHQDPGANSMLIQIADTDATNFATPKHTFQVIKQFKFLDIENNQPEADVLGITDQQAKEIYESLEHALKHNMNVIVHCVMGVCRSGAVVEMGVVMGFEDTGRHRSPNLRVKSKLFNLHADRLPNNIT